MSNFSERERKLIIQKALLNKVLVTDWDAKYALEFGKNPPKNLNEYHNISKLTDTVCNDINKDRKNSVISPQTLKNYLIYPKEISMQKDKQNLLINYISDDLRADFFKRNHYLLNDKKQVKIEKTNNLTCDGGLVFRTALYERLFNDSIESQSTLIVNALGVKHKILSRSLESFLSKHSQKKVDATIVLYEFGSDAIKERLYFHNENEEYAKTLCYKAYRDWKGLQDRFSSNLSLNLYYTKLPFYSYVRIGDESLIIPYSGKKDALRPAIHLKLHENNLFFKTHDNHFKSLISEDCPFVSKAET